MVSESQLSSEIARVLNGEVRLEDFEDWLAAASWNMHKSASQQLQALVTSIQIRLAERAQGHLSDDSVLNFLRSLVRPDRIELLSGTVHVCTYTVSFDRKPARVLSQGSANSITIPASQQNRYVVFDDREPEPLEA